MNMNPLIYRSALVRRVVIGAALVALAGCQYLQPRSVDDIERGKLPAPIERTDTRDGLPVVPSANSEQLLEGLPENSAVSPMQTEAERLASQRDKAASSAILVLSAGATRASGLQAGSQLTLEFRAAKSGESRKVTIDIGCGEGVCVERRLKLSAHEVITRDLLTVTELPQGRWKLHSASLVEVSELAKGEQSYVTFKQTPDFSVRNGHATYLGTFTVVGGAQRINRGSGGEIVRLPLVRYSNLERDMERALTQFPAARGRRMINEAKTFAKPQPVK